MNVEYRSATAMVTGSRTGSGVVVGGIGMPYLSDSQPLPWIEQFAPDAFADQATDGFTGVEGRFQHVDEFVLASVDSATMTVTDGARGLGYTMQLPPSLGYIQDLVGSGVVAGASVGFRAISDEWSVDAASDMPRRLVRKALLGEISLVSSPAYRATSASITALGRSLPRSGEERVGKTISAQTASRLQAVHDSLMDAALGLRDLIDVAKTGAPADSDVGAVEEDSIVVGLKGSPEDSLVGAAAAGDRFVAPLYSTSTIHGLGRDIARRQRRLMRQRLAEAELQQRVDAVELAL